jgi:predicted transposase YbfD/YdcC
MNLPDPRPYFDGLEDPRRETKNKLHPLNTIFFIVLCAVLSGIEDWVGMEDFAEDRIDWFRRYLPLEHGVPSHDTLSNVMGRIKPKEFSQRFTDWVTAALPSLSGTHIAIDGKALNGSYDSSKENSTIYMMSAFASQARLVLAQQHVEGKGNEIGAIPELLDMLNLEGAVVTIDAIGAQKKIVQHLTKEKADYVISLKGNQGNLHADAKLWLDTESKENRIPMMQTVEKSHGRIETRRYWLSTDLLWLNAREDWAGLQSLGMVEAERTVKGKTTVERRYYISSLDKVDRFSEAVRDHWSIENQQHWVLDVQFGEDDHRARKDYRAPNLATVRRIALNLLRRNADDKRSLRRRKRLAGLNDTLRAQFLFGEAEGAQL